MRYKGIVVCMLFVIVSTGLIGCASKEKIEEAIKPVSQTEESVDGNLKNEKDDEVVKDKDLDTDISDDLKEQAEKEGVTVGELQATLDGLTELGAQKYGISVDEYIKQIEDNGNTVLSEWQQASDYMDISITDLYTYEKQKVANMSDEEKETMAAMNDALSIAKSELSDPEAYETTTTEEMLGIYGNNTGEIRIVTMDDQELREALTIDTSEIIQDYHDEYSIVYEYISKSSYEVMVDHYVELLENTEEYLRLEPIGALGVMLQGTINETLVYVDIDNTNPDAVKVNTYLDLTSQE